MLKKKGFTLIELVVVMAIIAVLSLLIIAAIQAARSASVESQNRGNARTIEVALEAVAARNNGSYCGDTGGIACAADSTTTITLSAAATTLADGTGNAYLSDASSITGGVCSTNGGGTINVRSNSFTIYVADSDCVGTASSNIAEIVH